MATIIIAYICSMVLFGALCHAMGPQDGFGDISCNCCGSKPKVEEGDQIEMEEEELADVE